MRLLASRRARRRAAQVFFGAALVLLFAIALWWLVLLERLVRADHVLREEALQLEATVLVADLARRGAHPGPGPLATAPGFVVSEPLGDGLEAPLPMSTSPAPTTPLVVRPARETLVALETRLRRRHVQALGEGSLLLALVGVSALMLLRLVKAERARWAEVQGLARRVTGEVRAPIGALRELLTDLRDGRVAPEALADAATRGLRDAERAEHLVEALLTAQRVGLGSSRLARTPLDLAATVTRFAEHRRRSLLDAEEIALDLPPADSPADSPVIVRADEDALHLVLDGLADEAARRGGGALRLAVAPAGRRALLRLTAEHELTVAAEGLAVGVAKLLARQLGGEVAALPTGWELALPRAPG